MRSNLGRMKSILAVATAVMFLLPAAWGKGFDDFKLTKAIPADSFLAVHGRDHAGKEFVNKQMARVWEALENARLERDVKRMFKAVQKKSLPPGAELEGFEEQWQQMMDLWASVEWSSLSQREFAMGMKVAFPTTEIVMLMVPPEDKVQSNFEGLGGVVKALVELDPNGMQLVTEEEDGLTIHRVTFVGAPFPLGLTLARHNDVIMFGFGSTMVEQSLALLKGEGGESLAATARFQEAFKKLPPATDELVFFDVAKWMGQVRGVVGTAVQMAAAGAPAEGEPGYDEFKMWTALPGKILDSIDMFEYMATVSTTDGMLTTADSVTVLRDDAKTRALYPVLFGNKPLAEPLKYVPENAGEFFATSGIDLHALFTAAVKIIREDVPDGGAAIAQMEALKDPNEGIGLDVEQDIFGWVGGSLTSVSYTHLTLPTN